MRPEPGIEGRLDIDLRLSSKGLSDLTLRSSRPIGAVAIFQGKPLDQVLGLMPVMFSLCGRAQTIAGLAAGEAALGLQPSPDQQSLRDLLILAEAFEQDALRMALDWAVMVGRPADVQVLQALRLETQKLIALLSNDRAWRAVGACDISVDRAALLGAVQGLRDALRSGFGPNSLPCGLDDLMDWIGDGRGGLLQAVLHWASQPARASLGRTDLPVLGRPDLARLDCLLRDSPDRDFERAPAMEEQFYETGPLDGLIDHPIIVALQQKYGLGLMVRLVARCLHLWQIPEKMQTIITSNNSLGREAGMAGGVTDQLGDMPIRSVIAMRGDDTDKANPNGGLAGLAAVETARGWLVHRLVIGSDDRVIRQYQSVAPTEWNFHPQGPLVQGLKGVALGNWEEAREKTALLVTALDPCVSFQINQIEADLGK